MTFSGDPEALAEAKTRLQALNEEIKRHFDLLAYQAFMGREGGVTRPVVELGIALGIFSREAGESALRLAEISTAMEQMAGSSAFAVLSVGDQASAVHMLMLGMADTGQQAIDKLIALRAEHEATLAAFRSGVGTQIYWDRAAGEPPTAQTVQVSFSANPDAFNETMSAVRTDLADLTISINEVPLDLNPDPFNEAYAVVATDLTAYIESDPTVTFYTEHRAAESVIDRLLEKAQDRTVTYTYNVVTNGQPPQDPDKRAGGGPVWPGTWLVGERGPELVTLSERGYVFNADQTRRMLSGNAPIITVNIDARGIDRHEMYYLERAAKNSIVKALKSAGYTGR